MMKHQDRPSTVGSVPAAQVSRPEAIAQGRNQPTDYSPDAQIPCAWEALQRFHKKAGNDNHRTPSMRLWHRGQAEHIRRKLSSPEFRAWSWERLLAAAKAHAIAAKTRPRPAKQIPQPTADVDITFPWSDLLDAIEAELAEQRAGAPKLPPPLT